MKENAKKIITPSKQVRNFWMRQTTKIVPSHIDILELVEPKTLIYNFCLIFFRQKPRYFFTSTCKKFTKIVVCISCWICKLAWCSWLRMNEMNVSTYEAVSNWWYLNSAKTCCKICSHQSFLKCQKPNYINLHYKWNLIATWLRVGEYLYILRSRFNCKFAQFWSFKYKKW